MVTRLPVAPDVIADECWCLGLKRAARAVGRRYDEGLRAFDLNNGQFSMLTTIAGLEPVSVQRLADGLAMDRTTVTAALKPLQRRGLVEISVSPSDPRGRDVTLCADGRGLLARAMPVWLTLQADVQRLISSSDADGLRRQLSRLG
jgi:DNA-binding MarR family transcriptional regulator